LLFTITSSCKLCSEINFAFICISSHCIESITKIKNTFRRFSLFSFPHHCKVLLNESFFGCRLPSLASQSHARFQDEYTEFSLFLPTETSSLFEKLNIATSKETFPAMYQAIRPIFVFERAQNTGPIAVIKHYLIIIISNILFLSMVRISKRFFSSRIFLIKCPCEFVSSPSFATCSCDSHSLIS